MVAGQRIVFSAVTILVATAALWSLHVSLLISAAVAVDESSSCTNEDKDTAGTFTDTVSPPTLAAKMWTDEVGDKFQQFLQEKIFGQEDLLKNANKDGSREGEGGFLSHLFKEEEEQEAGADEEVANPFLKLFDRISEMGNEILESVDSTKKQHTTPTSTEGVLGSLLERVRQLSEEDQSSVVSGPDFLKIMQEALTKALGQMKNTFGEIMDTADASIAFAMMYYLAQEDALKNPSWKRRQHRFNEPVSKEIVVELHDALYLSQLSYVNSVEEFREGLAKFQNNEWELAYGTTDRLLLLLVVMVCRLFLSSF